MYPGNMDFVLNTKENLQTTAVTLTRQQNILLSLICILKYLANHLDMLDQPCAWYLKRILEGPFLTYTVSCESDQCYRGDLAAPAYHRVLQFTPKPDFRRQCTACGPIPAQFKILADLRILPFQNPEFKILGDFKILAF